MTVHELKLMLNSAYSMPELDVERYCAHDIAETRALYEKTARERIARKQFTIKRVIFNYPATIVYWTDGTKTVVKATGEKFDPEKGLAMAIAKRAFGNAGNYYNVFRKWCGGDK